MTTTLTFIDTDQLPRVKTPQGAVTEILNEKLEGVKNVFGTLGWLDPGENFEAAPLDHKAYEVARGAGVDLGPSESATIRAGGIGPQAVPSHRPAYSYVRPSAHTCLPCACFPRQTNENRRNWL